MLYTELNFLFFILFLVFLKLSLPKFPTKILFLLSSLFWYFLFGLHSFLLIIGLSFFNILMFYIYKNLEKKFFLYTWVILNLILMIFLKTKSSFLSFNSIGLSFFCFSSLLSIKEIIKKGDVKFQDTLHYFILTPFFFPALVQGPIEPPSKIIKQLDLNLPINLNNAILGFTIILLGYFKYHFIYSHLYDFTLFLFHGKIIQNIILASFLATLSAYALMSSYCDIGRGVSKIFGIDVIMNFRPIIWAKSPIDFWNRWNISLGHFLKENVTFPLMLRFGKIIPHKYFVLLTFIIFGLWHEVTWSWFFFGAMNGIYVLLYSSQTIQNFLVNQSNLIQKTVNLFFVILIIISNGFITNYQSLISSEVMSNLPPISTNHFLAIVIFFIIESMQKDLNTDFLKSYKMKHLILISFILLTIGLFSFINYNLFSIPPAPPLYFKF